MKNKFGIFIGLLAALALLCGPSLFAETIRVDSVTVTAKSWEEAESAGKTEALKRALEMLGSNEIPADLREIVMDEKERLVTIRQALNRKKNNGVYTPVFFCDVDRAGIEAIVKNYRTPTLQTLRRPRVNVAVVFRSLPTNYISEKNFFLDRVNNLLEEHFGRAGFQIGTPPSKLIVQLDQQDPRKVFHAFVRYSTEVNYLLFGAMDLLKEDVVSMDNGKYFKTKVGLTLRFFSVSSDDQVSFGRDVYGVGENDKASILDAMGNCAKVITEKAGAHRVIENWETKLQEGFEYSLMFCSFKNPAWIKQLRRALKDKGDFVSKSRGDNVTEIYRYHANPGEFVFPSVDFEDFMLDLDGFDMVESGVVLAEDKLYFVFGDDPQCLDMGFDASEATKSVGGPD